MRPDLILLLQIFPHSSSPSIIPPLAPIIFPTKAKARLFFELQSTLKIEVILNVPVNSKIIIIHLANGMSKSYY